MQILSYYSISCFRQKFNPAPLFQPRVEKNFDPPPRISTLPHLKKKVDPHLALDNSNTAKEYMYAKVKQCCEVFKKPVCRKHSHKTLGVTCNNHRLLDLSL